VTRDDARATESFAELALPHARFERQVHLEDHVERPRVLARIEAALDRAQPGGYVLVLGGPGAGKSALLAELSRKLEAPFHFLRSHRDPARFVPALVAQCDALATIGERSPPMRRGVEADELKNELVDALDALRAARGRACVVIDGLDELDRLEPTLACLPTSLPTGCAIVLSSRPEARWLHRLRARLAPLAEVELGPLDVDEVRLAIERWLLRRGIDVDADATERLLATTGGLASLVFRALHRARRVGRLDLSLARADSTSWHEDLFAAAVERGGPTVAALVELLSVAREPVAPSLVHAWLQSDPRSCGGSLADLRAAIEATSELLEGGGTDLLRLWHAGFASHVRAQVLGPDGVRAAHARIADASSQRSELGYARRHRVAHLVEAGREPVAKGLAEDVDLVAQRVARGEIPELLADLDLVGSPLCAPLRRHAGHLRQRPIALGSVLSGELGERAPVVPGARLRFLDGRASTGAPELGSLLGHEDEVLALGVSPDGSVLASASADGTARLWSKASGSSLWSRRLGPRRVLSLAWSEDGRRIAFGADDGVAVLDAASGEVLRRHASASPVWGVAWLRGAALAWAARDGALALVDASGASLWSGRSHAQTSGLVASPDGRSLAVLGARGGVTIAAWRDDLGGEPERTRIRPELEATVWSASFVDEALAFARHDGVVELWRIPRRPNDAARALASVELPDERPFAIAATRDGWFVGTSAGAVRSLARSGDSLEVVRTLRSDVGAVNALVAIEDEVWMGGASGRIEGMTWLRGRDATPSSTADDAPPARPSAWTAHRDEVVIGDDRGWVRGVDADRRERWRVRVHTAPIAALHAESRWLAAGSTTGALTLSSLGPRGPTKPSRAQAHEGAVTVVRVLPERGAVLSGGRDHGLSTRSVFGLRPLGNTVLDATPRALHVSPDGRVVVVFHGARGCSAWTLPGLDALGAWTLDGPPLGVVFEDDAIDVLFARGGAMASQSISTTGAAVSRDALEGRRWLVGGASPVGRELGLLATEAAVLDGSGRLIASAPLGSSHWIEGPRECTWIVIDEDAARWCVLDDSHGGAP
jgi:hypothetical protein